MNERIQELLSQAISDVDYIRDDDKLNEELSEMFIPDVFAERFAELIVQECCNIVNKQLQHNNPNDCLLVLDIKQHFGVEE